MGLLASKNGAAFIISSLIGFVVARYLFEGTWATYAYILISYHLFLAWLVITAEHETGFSLPIFSTMITHLACLIVVIGLTVGRHYIPFFGLIRYCIPAMAPFERDWLFSGNAQKKDVKKKKVPAAAAVNGIPVHVAIAEATAEDHEAWIRYLAQPNRATKKPGLTVKDEYEQWLVARIGRRRAAASSKSLA
jgi:hypothetical protein